MLAVLFGSWNIRSGTPELPIMSLITWADCVGGNQGM